MKVGVFTDEAAVAKAAAAYLMETMDAATVCNLGVATGSTLSALCGISGARRQILACGQSICFGRYIGLEFGHSELSQGLQNGLGADKVGLADENLSRPTAMLTYQSLVKQLTFTTP